MRVELDFGFVVVRVPDNALAAHLVGRGHETTIREAKRQLAEVAEWVEALRDSSGAGRAARDERLTGEQFDEWGSEQQGMIEQEPSRKSQARLGGRRGGGWVNDDYRRSKHSRARHLIHSACKVD